MSTTGAVKRWCGDARLSGTAVTSRRLPPSNSARYAAARVKYQINQHDSSIGV
jgi:hypothetical protein